MTTNKLDELIEDYTIELRNSIGSLLPTPHPDDFKQAIEAYIAERIKEARQAPRLSYYDNPVRLHDIPCQFCGSKEWVDWVLLPHELFNIVCPGGDGYLCFDCFVKNYPQSQLKSNERS